MKRLATLLVVGVAAIAVAIALMTYPANQDAEFPGYMEADLVLVMSPAHAEAVRQLGGGGKVHRLDEYAFGETSGDGITDPFGGELESYRTAADVIQRAVKGMFDRLSR